MHKLLLWAVAVSVFSWASAVKEWKNFENGKVYSRKMTTEKKEIEDPANYGQPIVEERLLHSHHKDKNKNINLQQSVNEKPIAKKNAERHHKKTVEEEMHLRPLNERHHKFPNPALLDKTENNPSSKVSRHTFLQQVRRKQNRKRQRGGKRQKRNKDDHKNTEASENNPEMRSEEKVTENKMIENQEEPKTPLIPKVTKVEPMQFTQTRRDEFPMQQTSYW